MSKPSTTSNPVPLPLNIPPEEGRVLNFLLGEIANGGVDEISWEARYIESKDRDGSTDEWWIFMFHKTEDFVVAIPVILNGESLRLYMTKDRGRQQWKYLMNGTHKYHKCHSPDSKGMPTRKYLLTPVDVLDKIVNFIEGRYLAATAEGKKWDYIARLLETTQKRMSGEIRPFHKAR